MRKDDEPIQKHPLDKRIDDLEAKDPQPGSYDVMTLMVLKAERARIEKVYREKVAPVIDGLFDSAKQRKQIFRVIDKFEEDRHWTFQREYKACEEKKGTKAAYKLSHTPLGRAALDLDLEMDWFGHSRRDTVGWIEQMRRFYLVMDQLHGIKGEYFRQVTDEKVEEMNSLLDLPKKPHLRERVYSSEANLLNAYRKGFENYDNEQFSRNFKLDIYHPVQSSTPVTHRRDVFDGVLNLLYADDPRKRQKRLSLEVRNHPSSEWRKKLEASASGIVESMLDELK